MKNFKSIAVFSMIILGGIFSFAQEIAHIDVQSLLTSMPEYKKAQTDIEAVGKKHQTKLEELETSYKKFVDDVQKELAGKSQDEAQKLIIAKKYQEKDQEMQQKAQTYRKAAQEELVSKENSLMAPIEKKLNDAIDKVASKKGIKYVFPAGVTVYNKGGYDLSKDVKKELGL